MVAGFMHALRQKLNALFDSLVGPCYSLYLRRLLMPRYDVLLFDLDDTLLDFGIAEKSALKRAFREGWVTTMTPISIYRFINIIIKAAWRVI